MEYPHNRPYTADDLVRIITLLRDPVNGCPWDKVQTHTSIRMNFLEEAYEAVDALDLDDPVLMCEELGDVLMQVAFHAVIEEERGRFTFEDVCREVCEKLVFRHPNIFASSAAQNAGINGWDALKNKEKGRTTLADELDTVPLTLPALEQALSGGFFQLELADDTRLRRDLWDRCGDDTLRGLFLRRLRQEYDAADPRRQKEIEQAVRFGLAAMDNKEL